MKYIKRIVEVLMMVLIIIGIISVGLFIQEGNLLMLMFSSLSVVLLVSLLIIMNSEKSIDYGYELSLLGMVEKHELIVNHHKKYWDLVEWYVNHNDVLYLAYCDKPKNDWHNHIFKLTDLDAHIVRYGMLDINDESELVINRS